MKAIIDADTKTFIRFWIVPVGFTLAGWMVYSAREALLIIGAAFFLALALSYPVKRLASVFPGKSRLGGTALAFASLIIILSAIIWFVIPPIVQQSAKFAESIPALSEKISTEWRGLSDFIDNNGLRAQVDTTVENIKGQAASWTAKAGSNILEGVGSLASFIVSTFLVIVLSFLMLIEGPTWMKQIWGLYIDKKKMARHKNLVNKSYNVVTGYINGQLTVSGIGALVAGSFVFILSLFIPDVDGSLAMPTILATFILSLIPMFGATLAGVLITLLLMLNSLSAGVIYGIFFIIYQQIENNFISPVIQAKKVELSALAVLVSVTIGIYVAGIVGGIIAIPVAGTLKVFLEDYLDRNRGEEPKSAQPNARLAKKSKT